MKNSERINIVSDIHGGDIYRHQVIYDFSVSINPLGMPEGSIRAAKDGIERSVAYPDAMGITLRQAIAEKENCGRENPTGEQIITPQQIVLGNGAAELIYAICYALRPQKTMVMAPSFYEYEAAAHACGSSLIYWNLPKEKDFCLDETFISALTEDIDLVFLCNPNNPTGSVIEPSLLWNIAARCEEANIFLCVDECFLPFLEREDTLTFKHELGRFPHLILLRAFTKIYGMPGLRLGYVMSGNVKFLETLRNVMQPWNTSIPAQMAGIEALKDLDYLRRTRELLAREREYLCRELSEGLAEQVYKPTANFVFFRSREDLKLRLLEKGILIRCCANFRNLENGYFRIGIRTHEENRYLINKWREISKETRE